MPEIKREPIQIKMGETTVEGFDEDHTHGDIVRWLMKNRTDAECVRDMLTTALGDGT